jgi:hypothetical protein
VVAAVIAAVSGLVVAIVTVMSRDSTEHANSGPTPTGAPGPTLAPASPNGTIDAVNVSPDGAQVTVRGRTTAEIVAVLVGPRPGSESGYWASGETVNRPQVTNGSSASVTREVEWNVVVSTDPRVSNNYTVEAFYDSPPPAAAEAPAPLPGIAAAPPPPAGFAPRIEAPVPVQRPAPIEAIAPQVPINAPAPAPVPLPAPVPVLVPGFRLRPTVTATPPVGADVQLTIDKAVSCDIRCSRSTYHGTFGPA